MIDCVTKKGLYHKCMPQDYAIAVDIGTAKEPLPIIAVADGCSAGRYSERGAMILCCAAVKAIAPYLADNPREILKKITGRAFEAADILGLEFNDMIATLRVAYVYQNILYTIETGDGFTFQILKDGEVQFDQYEYEYNAPYYLAYKMFREENAYAMNPNHLIVARSSTKSVSEVKRTSLPATEMIFQKIDIREHPEINYFGVASDGLSSYQKNVDMNVQGVTCEAIFTQLGDIKSPAGEFLTRRFHKMDKELSNRGFENYDDVGIACINLDCCRTTVEVNK